MLVKHGTIQETPLSNALGLGDVDGDLLCSLYLAEAFSIPPCRGGEAPRCRPEHCCLKREANKSAWESPSTKDSR